MDFEAPEVAARLRAAKRVHIIGGSGAGKSGFAEHLGRTLALPVHHLDEIALDSATKSRRPLPECRAAATMVAAAPAWITEGIFEDWTDDLFRAADIIVWFDNVSAGQATVRILRRFARAAIATATSERGTRRFIRFRDYARELRGLAEAMRETRSYHGPSRPMYSELAASSRRATVAALEKHRSKTVRLRDQGDVDALAVALG